MDAARISISTFESRFTIVSWKEGTSLLAACTLFRHEPRPDILEFSDSATQEIAAFVPISGRPMRMGC